ncbi:3TM-type holin [Sphingobium aromaticiconvertens]|uniref:3TM-type holin n=1 Tax=Sphingobium aromaticiconvertens TaxID=365341 RepID=UPI0030165E1F
MIEMGPVVRLIDRVIPDEVARNAAKLELLRLESESEQFTMLTEAESTDLWTSRARPAFLYVIYALLLWAIPMGLIAGVRPDMAEAITQGMRAYLESLPEPLYALFGTGYLGYTAARAWGKAKGVER